MVNDFVVAADRIEKYEIAFAQVALAHGFTGRFLIFRAPLQVDTNLGKNKLRKRRAIEDQSGRVALAKVVFDASPIALGNVYDTVGPRTNRGFGGGRLAVRCVSAICRYVAGVAPLVLNFQPVAVHFRDDMDILSGRNQANDASTRTWTRA